jgi:hypothetical protein
VIVVLDASVILKWLLEDPAREPDTEKAFALVESVVSGRLWSGRRESKISLGRQ